MRLLVIIVIVWLVVGCSSAKVKPFAEISLGAQVNGQTDYWLQNGRDWQCSKNVQFRACAGIEIPDGWTIEYCHLSSLLCGGPFNDLPEVYSDDIRATKKIGGLK